MTPYKISPSDLTFLWDECPRCFYLKVKHGFKRPSAPFPSIFTRIDSLMKAHFQDQDTRSLEASLPPGKVQFSDRWVGSQPIRVQGQTGSCYLLGKFDAVLAFEDGSFGVVDFKTSQPRPHFIEFYGRQLHAYAYALEHPGAGKFGLAPISRLGLFVVEPTAMQVAPNNQLAYLGSVSWIEIEHNQAAFLAFLGEVLRVLNATDPPRAGEACAYCLYRQASRQHPGY